MIFRMLCWLIDFTIIVALAGGLVDMTRDMGQAAIHAQRTGIVSLRELNRELIGK